MAVDERVTRSIVVKAGRERVWQALSCPEQRARWFAASVDAAVDEVDLERRLVLHRRSAQGTSLVELELDDAEEGTRITVTETALAASPAATR